MFPPYPQRVRLVEDLDGYFRVFDTADWHVVLNDLRDESGSPVDPSGANLHMQIRPVTLPNLLVDDLAVGAGITVNGSSITLVSSAVNRFWRARETTVLVGDLMMERTSNGSKAITFLRRIHFIVEVGATQPTSP